MLNSFDNENLHAPLTEINITPLVDVLLVLLIVLMVCAPSVHSAISLELPKDKAQQIGNTQPIVIAITKNGEYFLEEKASSLLDLDNHLLDIAMHNSSQEIHLNADKDTSYGNITALLALLQKHNLVNIVFVTNPN